MTINLKNTFGKKYRVEYEESYYAEKACYRQEEEVHLQIIRCRLGGTDAHIYPIDGEYLAVFCRLGLENRTKLLKVATVLTAGDDGITYKFRLADFDAVADIVKPRQRKRMSDESKKKLVAGGVATRYKPRRTERPQQRQMRPN